METAYFSAHSPGQAALDWFDTLYYQYHHAVYANICKMIKQHEAAEDILQEVFMALWQNRQKMNPDKVGGWLFVTSYNKTLKYLRRKQQEGVVQLEQTNILYEFLQEEAPSEELYSFRLSMIEEAVNHLPARKKEVFRLCRYEGKTFDEVAHIIGISAGSVKDYLKQSNRFIRDYISKNYTETNVLVTLLLFFYSN